MNECPECGGRFPEGTLDCPNDGVPLGPEGAADPLVGKPVGSYVLSRCLGRGGMGSVYMAEHPSIGSRVAVKFLHRRYAADPAIVDRFFNEARAVNLIGHDNIVKVADFARLEDGSPYFVMEFLEGRALTALVGTPQPLAVTGPIFLQVAEGLAAAHDKGIIHRDLKPDNIFLVQRQRRDHFVKIVDFGIAKLQSNATTGRTATGMVMGTAQYMSPEQAGGENNRIGPWSDVYSVGVMAFQLATGRLPFDGGSFGEILIGHLTRPPPSPRGLVPSIDPAYETLILKCLEKAPENRFQSMHDLYDELGALLDERGLSREPPLLSGGSRPVSRPSAQPPSVPPRGVGPGTPSRPGPRKPDDDDEPTVSDVGPEGTAMMSAGQLERARSSPNAGRVNQASIPTPQLPRPPSTPEGTLLLDPSVLANAGPAPQQVATKSRLPLVIAAAGVVGVIAAAAIFALRPKSVEAPPPNVAAAPAEPPQPEQPTVAQVSVTSTPPNATITIRQEGRTFGGTTPFSAELALGREATIEVTLAGHLAQTETLTPSRDVELRYTLAPQPAPTPAVQRATPPPPPRTERVAETAPSRKRPAEPPKSEAKRPAPVGDGIVEIDF